MARASVIAQANGTPRELNQGGTSTSEVAFTTDGTVPVVLELPGALKALAQSGSVRFRVRAWGRVTTSGTLNFTAAIHYHTSLTSATITASQVMESSGTVSLASLTTNWEVEAELLWDGTGDRLNGYGWSQVHTTKAAETTIDNALTSIDPTATTTMGFIAAGTFGTGAAGNTCNLDGFEIEF